MTADPGAPSPASTHDPTDGSAADAEQQGAAAEPTTDPTTDAAPQVEPSVAPEHPAPERLVVPAMGLDADLMDLGLMPDGTLEVPVDPDDVGWFSGGGRPGGPGPTVIAAHVDGPDGPAAFYALPDLVPGDRIEVGLVDGSTVDYVVDEVSDHPKDEFPTHAVFGASPEDELRLVTCTGDWDPEEESYSANRVVYAHAVSG